jgi:hypothetical protein
VSFIRENKTVDVVLLSISFLLISSYTVLKIILEDVDVYWQFVPISVLGSLFLYEILSTLNGRGELFSATSIFVFFGFSFFYVVPLNQVIWDYWPSIPVVDGMQDWAGVWAILCIIGFFIIVFSTKVSRASVLSNEYYRIDTKKMHLPFMVAIAICVICQGIVLVKMGGYSGYISSYEMRLEESIQNYNPYDGFGFLFTFSEAVPNLISIYVVLLIKDKPWANDLKIFIGLVLILFIINMLFGGLRGSRSTTVWSLFWFVVLYHSIIKPLKITLLASLAAVFFLFMTSYSLYKFGGVEGIQGLWDEDVKAQVFSQKYIEDSEKFALVRDAGRTDVQSYVLKTYWNDDYPLSYGRTLIAGALSFVPGFLLPDKPVTAIKEKTGIFMSDYSFSETSYTTLLTGGYGEFIINFGILFGLSFFFFYGYIISWIDRKVSSQPKDSLFNIISPILMLLSIQLLMSDSNVISQFLFKFVTVPLIVLLICPKLVYKKSSNVMENPDDSFTLIQHKK